MTLPLHWLEVGTVYFSAANLVIQEKTLQQAELMPARSPKLCAEVLERTDINQAQKSQPNCGRSLKYLPLSYCKKRALCSVTLAHWGSIRHKGLKNPKSAFIHQK